MHPTFTLHYGSLVVEMKLNRIEQTLPEIMGILSKTHDNTQCTLEKEEQNFVHLPSLEFAQFWLPNTPPKFATVPLGATHSAGSNLKPPIIPHQPKPGNHNTKKIFNTPKAPAPSPHRTISYLKPNKQPISSQRLQLIHPQTRPKKPYRTNQQLPLTHNPTLNHPDPSDHHRRPMHSNHQPKTQDTHRPFHAQPQISDKLFEFKL
jgi:hypothetical protein